MKSIGLFGGTFDPLHNGHLRVCSVIKQLPFVDKVFIHVNERPSYKKKPMFSFEQRLKFANEFGASVIQEPFNYTCDVLKFLRKEFGKEVPIFFFCGQEWELGKFKNSKYVLNNCEWAKIRPIEINIRSTDIRHMIKNKEPLDGLVPTNVLNVIKEKYYV